MSKPSDQFETRVKNYLENRVNQYISWYDEKAIKTKRKYLRARVVAAVGAVIVPIVGNTELQLTVLTLTLDVSRLLLTIVSFSVAILITLEGILHYREQWQNYRSTEQFLQTQRTLFENKVGDYSELDENAAFKELVARVEGAIAEENAVTLSVLTRSDASSPRVE